MLRAWFNFIYKYLKHYVIAHAWLIPNEGQSEPACRGLPLRYAPRNDVFFIFNRLIIYTTSIFAA